MPLSSRSPYMEYEFPESDSFSIELETLLSSIKRVTMRGIHWVKLCKSPISRKKLSLAAAMEAAKGYELIKESMIIQTEDGHPLVYFIQNALSLCFSNSADRDLLSEIRRAISDLTLAYIPPVPKKDKRHSKTEKERWAKMGKPWRIYHFAYWSEMGNSRGIPALSGDMRTVSKAKRAAVKKFLQAQAPVAQALAMWLEGLDVDTWGKYRDCYSRLLEENKLGILHQSPRGCFTGMALLINASVKPHRDQGDVKEGLVATTCVGQFEGGLPVFPALGMIFNQRPGDILFARSALLEHWVTPITGGERYSLTNFTKGNVMCPAPITDTCDLCGRGYSKKGNLVYHWRDILKRGKADTVHTVEGLVDRLALSRKGSREPKKKQASIPKT